MKKKSLSAVLVGVGNTGVDIANYIVERGAKIVGAVDVNPAVVGKRLGDLTETGSDVVVSSDLSKTLQENRPDIAIVCTASALEDVEGVVKCCLSNQVNVITTAEKAFAPGYNKNQTLAKELDMLAKENGVTFYASGVQDILWVAFASTLSGLCNQIDRIYGENYALIDGFGPFCLEEAFVGKKVEEFSMAEPTNDDFNYALSVVAKALDLEVTEEKTEVAPILAKEDVYSEVADVHVKKGDIVGVLTKTEMYTKEGVTLAANFYEKLREPGDTEKNYWKIEGVPTIELVTPEMYGEVTTCTTVVNRLVDVVEAKPGFLDAADLPLPRFRGKEMGLYV